LISGWVIWTRKREKGKVMSIKLAFPEFGGKGDRLENRPDSYYIQLVSGAGSN
jgi:hypothetical protein